MQQSIQGTMGGGGSSAPVAPREGADSNVAEAHRGGGAGGGAGIGMGEVLSRAAQLETAGREGGISSFDMVFDLAMVIIPMRIRLRRWHYSVSFVLLTLSAVCIATIGVLLAGFNSIRGDYGATDDAETQVVYVLYAVTLSLAAISAILCLAFAGFWTIGSYSLGLYLLS